MSVLISWAKDHRRSRESSAIVSSCHRTFVGISWINIFFSWVNSWCIFFSSLRFPVAVCMRKYDRKQKYINSSQIPYSIPYRLQQFLVLFMLERYFIYQISYAITQVSFLLITYSLITIIYNYCKTTCAIVLLIIRISLWLVLCFPLLEKNPSSFFNFGSTQRRKKLSFRAQNTCLSTGSLVPAVLTAWQNCPHFIHGRLMNNKINMLHKST